MNKIFSLLGAALIAGAATTSCIDSKGPSDSVEITYGGGQVFNYVYDHQEGTSFLSFSPSYKMGFDRINAKFDLDMSNIQLSSTFGGLSFRMPQMDLKYSTDEYAYVIQESNVVPTNATGQYTFNTFLYKAVPGRAVLNSGFPIYYFRFKVNDRYEVNSVAVQNAFLGKTTVQNLTEGTTFANDELVAIVVFNTKDMVATIGLYNYKFAADDSSPVYLSVQKVPASFTLGHFSLKTEEGQELAVNNQSNTTLGGCKVTDLSVESDLRTGDTHMTMTMDLTGMSTAQREYGVYRLTSTLGFFDMSALTPDMQGSL